MCAPPLTRHDRCKTCTPRASRATRPPSRPRPAEVQRRAAHAPSRADGGPHSKDTPCATAGASRSCKNRHIKCSPRSVVALPSSAGLTARQHHVPLARRDRSETSTHRATHATQPPPPPTHSHGQGRACLGWHIRVPPPTRHDCNEKSTHSAARVTQQPSPVMAGGGPSPGSTCVCRRQRVTVAARQARTVPLAQRDCLPQPRPAEGPRRAAHSCAATGASQS